MKADPITTVLLIGFWLAVMLLFMIGPKIHKMLKGK
jgi:hypothetical protein